ELTSRPAASAAFLDLPTAAQPHFTPDVAGAYQARLVVIDSLGTTSIAGYVNASVAACSASNLAWTPVGPDFRSPSFQEPEGTAGAAAHIGTRVTMTANFQDPKGSCGAGDPVPFAYQWALVSRPAGSAAQLDSGTAAMPAFVPDVPGDYQV